MESTATHSILARRPAAGGLSQFHLPLPNSSLDSQVPSMAASHQFSRYPSPPATLSPSDSRQKAFSPYLQHPLPQIPSSSHLTSSSGVSDSISPPAPSLNSSSSHSPHTSLTQYNNQNGWSMPNTSSYTYGSVAPAAQSSTMSSNYSRHLYSPSGPGGTGQSGYGTRNSQPSATGDGMAPPYENVHHPFSMPIPGSAASHSNYPPQPSHSQHLQHAILNSQTSQPSAPTVATPSDNYSRAPPPTTGYYTASSSTPQQGSFPPFPPPHHSPSQLSPTTTGGPNRAIPALGSQHTAPMGALPPYGNRSYNNYSTNSLGSMVLSNMGNPGGQMHLMGTTNTMNAYHPGHGLPHHGIYAGGANSQQDRPYRCDTCPGSFNRNHDLKRHKRIHLAVKPYPCEFCGKAFSRTDALKVRQFSN